MGQWSKEDYEKAFGDYTIKFRVAYDYAKQKASQMSNEELLINYTATSSIEEIEGQNDYAWEEAIFEAYKDELNHRLLKIGFFNSKKPVYGTSDKDEVYIMSGKAYINNSGNPIIGTKIVNGKVYNEQGEIIGEQG